MCYLETVLRSPAPTRPSFNMKGTTILTLCLTTLTLLTLSTGIALGDGAGAVSVTQTFHNTVQTMPVTNPCTGANGTVTTTYNGVAHATFLTSGIGAGTGWITFTLTGTFVLTPDDPSQPTFTGHVTVWDGGSFNLNNFATTMIFIIHATGSDGSTLTFHQVAHVSVSASGIFLSFNKPTCG